ncbi:GIY-YIG nuclease family protein [Corynebacterium sanguinis]|uniref:GIY-YIG nuclease family protein n=1 Tax=Corynebacterium sanguinis TaxID=2594913 RepID=UPI00223B5F89|nr:GIY-YIG nuclease family protein [Corynebacterium sanguinis]MCT2288686.1 GIY-YIG nuclease family protein [Corynebacterium sanguinis]
MNDDSIEPAFRRFAIGTLPSVAALFPPHQRRGIYVLEFSNGEQYVGQALNVVARFTTHRHGSRHHEPWDDAVAIQFAPIESEPLAPIEFEHIERLRSQGIVLRNKMGNLGHAQPSGLDQHVSVEEQEHWVLGHGLFGQQSFSPFEGKPETKVGSKLKKENPELFARLCNDVQYALTELIPNAPELEARYWTLSDYPSTAGGRFATLNPGVLEFAVFPRDEWPDEEGKLQHYVFINLPQGTIIPIDEWEPNDLFDLPGIPGGVFVSCGHYTMCSTDALHLPVGTLRETLESNVDIKEAARQMAIELMRQNTSSLFARWHSRALVREVMGEAR